MATSRVGFSQVGDAIEICPFEPQRAEA